MHFAICPHCGGKARVPDGTRGGVTCPHCGRRYRPDLSGSPSADVLSSTPAASISAPSPPSLSSSPFASSFSAWRLLVTVLLVLVASYSGLWALGSVFHRPDSGADSSLGTACICFAVALAGLRVR